MSAEKVKIKHVGDMPVYQACMDLAVKLESATRGIPTDFKWLRIQALRSSESVCANLAEGFYAQYSTEYLQSLYRCRREGRETMTHLHYANRVCVMESQVVSEINVQYNDALNQLGGIIIAIERKISEQGKGRPLSYSVREDNEVYGLPSSIPHSPFPISDHSKEQYEAQI